MYELSTITGLHAAEACWWARPAAQLHPQLTPNSDNSRAGKHVTNDLFDVEKINWDAEVPTDAVVQLLSATDAPLGDMNMWCLDMQVRGRTLRQNYTQEARGKY